jgi:mono/diheme cytochrome c family protein
MRLFFAFLILALLLALTGISLVTAVQIEETPIPTSDEAQPPSAATPTIDRLAAPSTVIPPSQADDGAQLFWLWCQPCHGDQGQGLTDEWRAQYPEEDQNCWSRGCHGKSPYEEGFTLPTAVPAVIGEDSLFRYATLGQVFHYTRATMPFEYPGVLSDEEYLAVTAFLAREHGAWDGSPLTLDNVEQIRLRPLPLTGDDAQANQPEGEGSPVSNGTDTMSGENSQAVDDTFAWIGIALALLLAGGGWIWLQLK